MNNMSDSSVFCEIGLKSATEKPNINLGMTMKTQPHIYLKYEIKDEPLDDSGENKCSMEDAADATLKQQNQIVNEVAVYSQPSTYKSAKVVENEKLPQNNSFNTCQEYPISHLNLDKEKRLIKGRICATDCQIIPLDNFEPPLSKSSVLEDLESTDEELEDGHTVVFENLKTEYDAFLFFQRHGVIPSEMICTNNHQMIIKYLGKSVQWCCSKKICRKTLSVRQNTWLDGSKIPLKKIIKFIHAWAEEYGSQKIYREELDINPRTIIYFQSSLRKVCAQSIFKQPVVIGGEDITVEIGETCLTERKQRKGVPVPQQYIFGGFCRETEDVFLCAVPNTNEETLLECIKENIRPGSTIISDERKLKLENIEKIEGYNYKYITVDHKEICVDLLTGLHTQNIERTWLDLRARNKRQNGTARQMLDSYLCEYVWRNRNCTNNIFKIILKDIANFNK